MPENESSRENAGDGAGPEPEKADDGFLKWLIGKLVGQHPTVGYGVILALVVVFATLAAQQTGIMKDGFEDAAIFIGKFVAAGIAFIAVTAYLRRFTIIGNAIFGLLFLLGVVYICCFFAQFITNNRFTAIPRAPCFYVPAALGCPLSAVYTSADVAEAKPEVVEPDPTPDTSASPPPSTHVGPVYVHFAGSLAREDVKSVTDMLATLGWQVRDAARGGERIGTAAGLNEVRFFRTEDKEAAEQLASTYTMLANWTEGQALTVRDLSNASFKARPGLLEVWTSRN